MSLFDQLVESALRNQEGLGAMQPVVEKELLHHDILREMSTAGLLSGLTFMGGTCLRLCYGSNRLSEDLDFTAGVQFERSTLAPLGEALVDGLQHKYGLSVSVSPPTRDAGNVDTWRLQLTTRPDRRDIPSQRINIDICTVPSYQRQPMMLRNHYGVDMGTAGLILQAETRQEILTDKLVAFGLRPNRLKNRDLWDMGWLHQQGTELSLPLLPLKLADHHCDTERFLGLLAERQKSLSEDPSVRANFLHEMRRFLPGSVITETVEHLEFWNYLSSVLAEYCRQATDFLLAKGETPGFKM